MMNARLGWLLVGCIIGFILGYFVRALREIKDKVEQVDQHVVEKDNKDHGFITMERMKNIAVLLAVLLTLYAAVTSQRAANNSDRNTDRVQAQQDRVQAQQDRSNKIAACNQQFLKQTIDALNARTTYTQSQNLANVNLQKSLSTLVTLSLRTPPLSAADARRTVEGFAAALKHFLELSAKSADKVDKNPYPKPTAFQDCLDDK